MATFEYPDEDGSIVERVVTDDLSPEGRRLHRAAADEGSPWRHASDSVSVVPELGEPAEVLPPQPAKSASKDEWATYAIATRQLTFGEASQLTRAQIIDQLAPADDVDDSVNAEPDVLDADKEMEV